MSGEVYAAAKASTCCDAVGEECPNGAPRKIAAGNFVGSPEGGGATFPAGRKLNFPFKLAAPSERVLHECAYNSETNGDGVKMFILGRIRPS